MEIPPAMDKERLSFLALHFIPGLGDYLIKQLVSYCGSAEEVFRLPKGKLMKIPGVGESTAAAVRSEKPYSLAERELKKAEKEGVEIIFYTDKKYPHRLKVIDDSPSLLYQKGPLNLNTTKTVGIVGTRQATSYGKEFVEKLVETLLPHAPVIISGLAYGIDIHAHKQALKHGLPTVGVLGSGIDIIYPAAHKEIAKRMENNGGIITENPFGTKPDAHNFPSRNRIIAGLCDALIVVEAALTGGALITAEIANSYNKDVFALPGNIGQSTSEGCNKLIKINKAHLITSVKDIEYIMNWSLNTITSKKESQPELFIELEPNEKMIISVLREKNAPITVDELSWKAGLSQGVLSIHLLNLELKNVIVALPGKAFKIK